MARVPQRLAVCVVLGLAAGHAGEVSRGLPGWREITAAAAVTTSPGAGGPTEGGAASTLRDGSVAATSRVVGHANLNAEYRMRFAWQAFASMWEWAEPQVIVAVDLLAADPATDAVPVCVKLLGRNGEGQYSIPLVHSDSLAWQPVAEWQDRQSPGLKAQWSRLVLPRPLATRGLRLVLGHHQQQVELGEVRVWGVPEAPPSPAAPAPLASENVRLWLENPWADTEGGSRPAPAADSATPWDLALCRRDTEPAMIGLVNTGPEVGSVTVGLQGAPPWLNAELCAVGAIEVRGTVAEWWAEGKRHTALINLFTPEQVRGFGGIFPPQFPDAAVWQDFPTLRLAPGKVAYVWLTLTAAADAPAGDVRLVFTVGAVEQVLSVRVLKTRLPAEPVVESIAYGGVNEGDSRAHHTTVNDGYRRFVTCNLVVHMNRWGTDFVKLAQDDPDGFRRLIREGVDGVYKDLEGQGYRREQILIEIWDEPNDANIDSWLLMAREVKAHAPTALIYANPPEEWEGHPCTLAKTVQPMAPYVDVWAPHLNLINQFPDTLACMKATGKPVWFYQNVGLAFSRREGAASGWYRSAPWQALKHDLQGVGVWSASSTYGDPWDDFDRDPYTDWPEAAVVFSDETGSAISTRNWEAWREGIEDVAIGRMLQMALQKGWLRQEDAEAARHWLAEAPAQVIAENQETQGATVTQARAQALAWLNAAWDDRRELDRVVVTAPVAK